MESALAEPVPLPSTLRATASDMLSLAYTLQQAINNSLPQGAADVSDIERLAP